MTKSIWVEVIQETRCTFRAGRVIRCQATGNRLFNGSEGERSKRTLSEDSTTTRTISQIIRGIEGKIT